MSIKEAIEILLKASRHWEEMLESEGGYNPSLEEARRVVESNWNRLPD